VNPPTVFAKVKDCRLFGAVRFTITMFVLSSRHVPMTVVSKRPVVSIA
jgi:hypothetical protein